MHHWGSPSPLDLINLLEQLTEIGETFYFLDLSKFILKSLSTFIWFILKSREQLDGRDTQGMA